MRTCHKEGPSVDGRIPYDLRRRYERSSFLNASATHKNKEGPSVAGRIPYRLSRISNRDSAFCIYGLYNVSARLFRKFFQMDKLLSLIYGLYKILACLFRKFFQMDKFSSLFYGLYSVLVLRIRNKM